MQSNMNSNTSDIAQKKVIVKIAYYNTVTHTVTHW